MDIELLAKTTLPLQPQLQWLFWSEQSAGFLVGDERIAFTLPMSAPGTTAPLMSARAVDSNVAASHPCNLPIPADLYEEFAAEPWHGFRFLASSAYDRAIGKDGYPVGDLLRSLALGPDYGHYLLHPSGLIISTRSGSIELLKQTTDGFQSVDRTKTRGRAALAFAAHPNQNLIAYGDNYGAFHAHRFDETKFGKASKIADKTRNASRLEFIAGGESILLGGMGYLAAYSFIAGKFALLHETAISVRDFTCHDDGKLIVVNQGLNGIAAYRYDSTGFTKIGSVKPDGPVHQIAVSKCQRNLAVSMQDSTTISLYRMSLLNVG